MNTIQKGLLRVFSPLAYVINEKMAPRSGLLGKIGKFFIVGPREYGVHPFNRGLIFLNRKFLLAQGMMMHQYTIWRSITANGYHMFRPFGHISPIGPLLVLISMLQFVFSGEDTRGYEPDRLSYVLKRMGGNVQIPTGSLNQRTSAHFIEINHIYSAEMLKRYHEIQKNIVFKRSKQSDQVKKTRYAVKGYVYIPSKEVVYQTGEN